MFIFIKQGKMKGLISLILLFMGGLFWPQSEHSTTSKNTLFLLQYISLVSPAFGADLEKHQAEKAPPEPSGYRLGNYKQPTPLSLQGAKTVTNQRAKELHSHKEVLFIDVVPRPPKPEKLPAGTIWKPKKRYNIEGSLWLPNVGYGVLNPEIEFYFESNLEKRTHGNKEQALLFYCLVDCWMSWNAAKRALSLGYTNIYWYPEGTDGWTNSGGALVLSEPVKKAD